MSQRITDHVYLIRQDFILTIDEFCEDTLVCFDGTYYQLGRLLKGVKNTPVMAACQATDEDMRGVDLEVMVEANVVSEE